jgi:hypothetical protein
MKKGYPKPCSACGQRFKNAYRARQHRCINGVEIDKKTGKPKKG